MIRDCAGCGEPMLGDPDTCPSCGRPTDLGSISVEGPPSGDQVRTPALAFALALLLPGAGQLYSGARRRGLVTLAFSIGFLAATLSLGPDHAFGGAALRAVLLLYVFGFLDAYFTAREVNRGLAAALGENPRVAAILNLIAPGFGYFYLSQRAKGLFVFLAFRLLPSVALTEGWLMVAASLGQELVAALVAADAYRIAQRPRAFALERAAEAEAGPGLPAFVPLGCAALLLTVYVLLMLIGALILFLGHGERLQ